MLRTSSKLAEDKVEIDSATGDNGTIESPLDLFQQLRKEIEEIKKEFAEQLLENHEKLINIENRMRQAGTDDEVSRQFITESQSKEDAYFIEENLDMLQSEIGREVQCSSRFKAPAPNVSPPRMATKDLVAEIAMLKKEHQQVIKKLKEVNSEAIENENCTVQLIADEEERRRQMEMQKEIKAEQQWLLSEKVKYELEISQGRKGIAVGEQSIVVSRRIKKQSMSWSLGTCSTSLL